MALDNSTDTELGLKLVAALFGFAWLCSLALFSGDSGANPMQALEDLKWPLQNISIRARFAERTLFGKDAPEKFKAYDLSANFKMPYTLYSAANWAVGTNLTASAGILRGIEKSALVVSASPELMLRTNDGGFTINAGIGLAAFSRHQLGIQDFGGPFQFVLAFGSTLELSRHTRIGYRFQHYSDARLNGSNTTGVDLHMLEFYYQF